MRDAAILMPSLFDHLVSEREQLVGYIDAERLGGLEIDHQLEFGRLGYRQFSGFRPLENAASVDASLMRCIRAGACVANQSARGDEVAIRVHRRKPMTRRQRDNGVTQRALKMAIRGDKKSSARSPTRVAKAAFTSPSLATSRICSRSPSDCAAFRRSLI